MLCCYRARPYLLCVQRLMRGSRCAGLLRSCMAPLPPVTDALLGEIGGLARN
jgi:hypothetical protein